MARGTGFGEVEGYLGYRLRRLDVLMMERLGEALAEIGLTPARATALQYIRLHEGCDQAELGRALGVNRASTMGVVNALVGAGLVARHPGKDRRSHALRLTDDGRAGADDMLALVRRREHENFAALSEAERAQFSALVDKLIRAGGGSGADIIPITKKAGGLS